MIIENGYRRIFKPDHPDSDQRGYVREHRLIMEKAIGRPLVLGEVVHHRDGNSLNNDLSNLQLLADNREHIKIHVADARARGIHWGHPKTGPTINFGQCNVRDCGKDAHVRGLCRHHYNLTVPKTKNCQAPECNKKLRRGRYCSTHYYHIQKYGCILSRAEVLENFGRF